MLTRIGIVDGMASIRERPTSKGASRWAVLWRDSETGKQTSLTFDTEDAAVSVRAVLDANGQSLALANKALATKASEGMSVQDLVELHLSELTRPNAGTIKRYRSIYNIHFHKRMGGMRADAVTHGDVVNWVKWMQSEGKSPKTIANAHAVLSAAMTTGVRHKIRADNPSTYISLPRDNSPESKTTFLSKAEFDLLYKAMPEHYKLLTEFLVGTGLRFSEATALTPGDFDLTASPPTVRVEKAWKVDENGRMYLGAPKSRRARRTVSLDPVLAAKIGALKKGPNDRIFTSENGGLLRSGGFHNYGWKKALEAAKSGEGVRLTQKPRPHDLRHTHASWLIQAGVNIFTVSRRLGHESITTTSDRYGHLLPEALQDASDAISRIMR